MMQSKKLDTVKVQQLSHDSSIRYQHQQNITACQKQSPEVAIPKIPRTYEKQKKFRETNRFNDCILNILQKNVENLINYHFYQKFQMLGLYSPVLIIIILDKNSMISKYSKNIIGIEKKIRPFFLKSSNIDYKLIIYKGYQPHYQWFFQHRDEFSDKDSFYCYDRCSVDLALEMALKNTNRVSYISTRNYQSVKLVSKNPIQNSIKFSQSSQSEKLQFDNSKQKGRKEESKMIINKLISDTAKKILKDYQFVLCNSYLDIHPLESYQKICGYLMIKPNEKILELFQGFKVCNEQLFKSFITLPLLNELRTKYLIQDELKVRKLERKQIEITDQDVESTLQKWRDIVQINTFSRAKSAFDQKQKLHWVIHNNLGEEISKKDLLNQKYLRFSYAIWT